MAIPAAAVAQELSANERLARTALTGLVLVSGVVATVTIASAFVGIGVSVLTAKIVQLALVVFACYHMNGPIRTAIALGVDQICDSVLGKNFEINNYMKAAEVDSEEAS